MDDLDISSIFKALTRPAMTMGVTFEYHMLNLILSMCLFIGISPFYGLVFLPLHLFGWMVCYYDAHFFRILAKRYVLPPIPNRSLWRARSYEPF